MKRFLENMIKDNPGFSAYLEEALQKDKVVVTRIVAVASLIMYGLFSVVDYYSVNENLIEIFSIRFVVCLYLLFTFVITFKKEFFLRHYGIFTASYYIVIGLGIELMMLFVDQNDLAFYTYFAGLTLVIFAGYTWTYLNSTVTFAITLFFILLYVGIIYFSKQADDDFIILMLINHVAFLMAAVVIGLLADILLKQYLYRQYMMQSRLREFLLTSDNLTLPRKNQEILASISNLHQYTHQLKKQILDAEYCNLLLSVNCLQLVQEDRIGLKNPQLKTEAWDNMTVSSFEDILPDSKVMALSENNKLYFSYLIKNQDKEEMVNKISLIMNLIEKNLNENYRANKVVPFIGSKTVFQTKTNALNLIEACEKNLLVRLDKYGKNAIKRSKETTNVDNIASFDKFVNKPINYDVNQN